MTLPCDDMKILLHGHLDGELDAANAFQIDGHLRTCPDCAGEYRRLKEQRAILRQDGLRHRAPGALRSRILEALEPAAAAPARPAPSAGGSASGRARIWVYLPRRWRRVLPLL